MKVEWIGSAALGEYHGKAGGGDDAQELHLVPGKPVDVSKEQAAYLAETFPGAVAIDGKASAAPAGAKAIEDRTKAELKAEFGDVDGFPRSGNQAAMVAFVKEHQAGAASDDKPAGEEATGEENA